MESRQLGNSELKVSAIGLGCNNFGGRIDAEASQRVIDRAIDVGITLFDTADLYGNRGGSEEILGRFLGARRDQIVLATKFGGSMSDDGTKEGGSAGYIAQAVEDSLRRLQTDRIDLYQMHFPDTSVPIEETLGALHRLVEQGKVRFIGCSNFEGWQAADALCVSATRGWSAFVSCQDEYSLLQRKPEPGILAMCQAKGVGLLPYFPLASGMLSGKYRRDEGAPEGTRFHGSDRLRDRYMTDRNWKVVEEVEAYAATRGHTLLDAAFAWLLAKPSVASVIAGATKPEQIDANARAGQWKMTAEDVAELDRISA